MLFSSCCLHGLCIGQHLEEVQFKPVFTRFAHSVTQWFVFVTCLLRYDVHLSILLKDILPDPLGKQQGP